MRRLLVMAVIVYVAAVINIGMYVWAGQWFSLVVAIFAAAAGTYSLITYYAIKGTND